MISTEQLRLLPRGLALLLALAGTSWLAWQAWTIWNRWQSPVQPAVSAAGAEELRPVRAVSELVPYALFGRQPSDQSVVEVSTEDLPETRLQLVLRGISSTTREGAGGALIETPDQETSFFSIGQQLPGNVRLHSIYERRVVLDRNGKLENLTFPEDTGNMVASYDLPESSTVEYENDTSYPDPIYSADQYDAGVSSEPSEQSNEASSADGEVLSGVDPLSGENQGADPQTQAAQEEERRKQQIRDRLQRLREQIRNRNTGQDEG